MSIYPSAPNLAVVCIDRADQGDHNGKFYHYYKYEPVTFKDFGELIMKLDDFYDEIDFPQAAYTQRSFGNQKKAEDRKELKKLQKPEELMGRNGDVATFVIHVQYRQNATWQGKILWADKKEERTFRSALEMIKLMDSAIEKTLEKEENKE